MANSQNIQNATQITFFGEVDEMGFATSQVVDHIAANEGEELELLINSPGGAVFEGINIASLLQRREAHTTTTATGLAASIATVVLMAGDTVQMDKDAFLMIHDAWAFEAGDSREMRKTARLLDKISTQIADIYTEQIAKSGKLIDGDREKTKEHIRQQMRQEKWLNAEEALKMGLIDKIVNAKQLNPMPTTKEGQQQRDTFNAKFYNRLTKFKNTPSQLLNKYKMCEQCNKENGIKNGASLTATLNRAVDAMTDDSTTRGQIIEQMASAAGISASTVNQILAGDIDCPPLRRLEGFASVLDISMKSIIDAGTRDGCNYGGETESNNKNNTMNEEKRTIWAAIKGFFVSEIKAEAQTLEAAETAEKEAQQDEQMTDAEMMQALKDKGYNIEKIEAKEEVKTEQPETKETETVDPMAAINAKLEALQKENEAFKAELKEAKFKAAAKASDAQGEGKTSENKYKISAANKAAFEGLAQLIKSK
jgi:ATP-dependent protease ClpP protease subunit/transcriptional regulator with XRE-family HTH domain